MTSLLRALTSLGAATMTIIVTLTKPTINSPNAFPSTWVDCVEVVVAVKVGGLGVSVIEVVVVSVIIILVVEEVHVVCVP